MKITKDIWESLTETDKQAIVLGLSNKFEPKFELDNNSVSDVDWITNHLYIPELSGAIWLAPYQKKFLNEALSKDKDGLYKYSLILYLDKKKHIKSCIAAGVALRRAFQLQWGNIMVVSNSLTQSQSRSFYYIVRSLLLNPKMRAMVESGDIKINRTEIVFNFNKTKIIAVPLAPDTQAGNNNDLAIFSEIWAYRHEAHNRMITETAVPPNLYGKAQRFMESYVGFVGESQVLERWFTETVKPENLLFRNPETYVDGQTILMWNHGLDCRMPWVTDDYLKQQTKELTPSEFKRVMLNEWVSSQNKFLDDLLIDAIIEKLPPLTEKESVIMAADAAVSGDCFAFVGITKHPTKPGCYAARLCKTWKPPHNGKIIFEYADAKLNASTPDGWITEIAKKYKVIKVVYDPYQLHSLATKHNFGRKSVYWDEFSQGGLRLEADAGLQRAIIDRTLYIDDSLIDLIQHLKNADAETNDDNKIRLVKRNQSLKIDAVVCLSMALNAISRLSI